MTDMPTDEELHELRMAAGPHPTMTPCQCAHPMAKRRSDGMCTTCGTHIAQDPAEGSTGHTEGSQEP